MATCTCSPCGLANAPTHLITLGAGDFTGDGRADLVTGGLHMNRPFDRLSRVTLWNHGQAAATSR